MSSTFTAAQKAIWEQAKVQALAKCRKLGLSDEAILHSLTRYLKATNFQIPLAIQRIMDYSFWMKSINLAEDIERFYPINKEYVDPQVLFFVAVRNKSDSRTEPKNREELLASIWLDR